MIHQKIIKCNNINKVFSLILENEAVSRAKLAKMTSFSKTTISSLVDELIANKYVIEIGTANTVKQGRKPTLIKVNSDYNVVVVINWTAKELVYSLLDISGSVINLFSVNIDKTENYPSFIREHYDKYIHNELNGRRILAVCLVVPSMLDSKNGKMSNSTLDIEDGAEIIDELKKEFFDVSFALFNDTSCLAYAELKLASLGFDTFRYVNMMNGIGDMTLIHGEMLGGQDGMRSQIGHFSIDRHGEKCRCGNVGCLENEIGETALLKRAKKLKIADDLLNEVKDINFETLGNLVKENNDKAINLVDAIASDLAFVLSNVETIVYTDRIIIGGKGYKLGDYYLNKLQEELGKTGFRTFIDEVKVQFTKLDDDAIYSGAALYFINNYYDFCDPQDSCFVIGCNNSK